MQLQPSDTWQTQAHGTHDQRYQVYLVCADDGHGGDITNDGKPLKTFEEWMAS